MINFIPWLRQASCLSIVDSVTAARNRGSLTWSRFLQYHSTWDMQLPPPMKSFLHQYDFSGKIVIPFNTNAGFGIGSSFDQVEDLCPDAAILKGFSIEGGYEKKGVYLAAKGKRAKEVEEKVREWLRKINI